MIDPLWTGPAELVLKATLLLAVGSLLSVLARRQAAAVRHLVWVSTFAGLLALPLVQVAGPTWSVPVLPVDFSAGEQESTAAVGPGDPGDVVRGYASTEGSPSEAIAGRFGREPVVRWDADLGAPGRPGPILLAWSAGSAVVVFWMLMGQVGVMRLRRRARPLKDPEWLAVTHELSGRLDLSRPVHLIVGEDAWTPMTWGLVRPTVLLPSRALGWSEERRRMVLLHELAHVKRGDCLTQLLGYLGCALFWFHPLVWHAARRLRIERELACDDLVVEAVEPTGGSAVDYAEHLLDIARTLRAPRNAGAGVAMALPSQLEGRLLAVLDPNRRRASPSLAVAWSGIAAALALVLPLSAMEPGPAHARTQIGGVQSGLQWEGALVPGSELAVFAAHGPIEATGVTSGSARVIGYATDVRPGQETIRLVTVEDRGRVAVCLLPRGARCTPEGIVGLADDVRAIAGRTEVVVQVPDGVSLRAGSHHGSLTLEGIRGDVSALTGLGSIQVSADGAVRARTGNGAIDVTMGRTDWTGEVALESGGGQVQLRLPPSASTLIAARTLSGGVVSDFPIELHPTEDGGGTGAGTIGRGGRELSLVTASGRISILRTDGDSRAGPGDRSGQVGTQPR